MLAISSLDELWVHVSLDLESHHWHHWLWPNMLICPANQSDTGDFGFAYDNNRIQKREHTKCINTRENVMI